MTSEIINIENDQSQQVIDAVGQGLGNKGVSCYWVQPQSGPLVLEAKGMGNGRRATLSIPLESLKDLSNEQIQEKASEIVREVEQKLRGGGHEV